MIILYILIIILLGIIALLAGALFFFIKKNTYISNKEKEFIIFVIDTYIEYAKELEIHSLKEHETIVRELTKIKKRHFQLINDKNVQKKKEGTARN